MGGNAQRRRAAQIEFAAQFSSSSARRLAAIETTAVEPRSYTTERLAVLLKRAPEAVVAMVRRGTLPAPDNRGRWDGESFDRWLEQRRSAVGGGRAGISDTVLEIPDASGSPASSALSDRQAAVDDAPCRKPADLMLVWPADIDIGDDVPEQLLIEDEPECATGTPIASSTRTQSGVPGERQPAEPVKVNPQAAWRERWRLKRGYVAAPPPKRDRTEYRRAWHAARRARLGIVPDPRKVEASRLGWARRRAAAQESTMTTRTP
jgi:hypothetical protein